MQIKTQEHEEIMAQFEKDFKGTGRMDREHKDIWKNGNIYQDGKVNQLFIAYRMGCAFAQARARLGM